ncbi:Methionine--tRNA ligase 1 [Frankliniella fusca]|uniref:Methionine--tRNA ligase 1 n=1 Tax=Frankliniella fusca TaxID=407009 RepID=A0AAE1H5R9_9NEOP|nr:Methionine--tRNA ligase 1 [Frankliniella fusca]
MDIRRSTEEITFALRPNGPEVRFWTTFFGIVNQKWLAAFQQRTMGGVQYIKWDFIEGVDRNMPMGQQYQQALAIVFDEIQKSLSANNCRVLMDSAKQVREERRKDHERFPRDPSNRMWSIHERILQLWSTVVDMLEEKSRT